MALLWSVTPSLPPRERRVRLAVCSACSSSGWLGAFLFLGFQKDHGLKEAAILFLPFSLEGPKLQSLISYPRGSSRCRDQITSLFLQLQLEFYILFIILSCYRMSLT